MVEKRKRGRPKKDSVMETIAVRLPYETIMSTKSKKISKE